MHISENFDGCLQIEEHGVLLKDFGGLIDQKLDGLLVEFNRLAPLLFLDFEELLDQNVQRKLLLDFRCWLHEVLILLKFTS